MTGDGLLAEVLANPDSDEPRLVYADWLMDRGDPRGEFIRIQCELAARTDLHGAELGSLQKLERELLQKHGADWRRQLGLERRQGEFVRGFVERVNLSGRLFCEHKDKLSTTPLRSLRFSNLSKQGMGQLLAWPGLARLHSLELSYNQIGNSGAKALANSQYLKDLTSLDLGWNRIGDAGVKALANSQYLTALTPLNLSGNEIGDEGAKALANSQYLKDLTPLYLTWNRIGIEGREALRLRFGMGVRL